MVQTLAFLEMHCKIQNFEIHVDLLGRALIPKKILRCKMFVPGLEDEIYELVVLIPWRMELEYQSFTENGWTGSQIWFA